MTMGLRAARRMQGGDDRGATNYQTSTPPITHDVLTSISPMKPPDILTNGPCRDVFSFQYFSYIYRDNG
jgi:hypothetical protein